MDPSLYVARAGNARVLDGASALWRAARGSEAHLLTHAEATVAALAQAFRPLSELVQLAQRQAGMPSGIAAAAVERLRAIGILAELSTLLPPPEPPRPMSEPLVAIRTCDRPLQLRRLLNSIAACEGSANPARSFVLVDDSADPESNARSRAAAQEFARSVAGPTSYFGPAEAGAMLRRFAASGFASHGPTLDGLLNPNRRTPVPTGARSWNWSVLLGAGRMLSILDDDLVFPLRAPPASGRVFELSHSLEPETHCFDLPEEARSLPPVAPDPFAFAAAYVGQAPGAILARDGYLGETAHGKPLAAVSHLRAGSCVAGAFAGNYGCMTFNSTVYLNTASEASLDDLLRQPYRHERLEGDNLWQGVLRPRIVPRAVVTPLLLDNRRMRPFAGSWGREDDTMSLHLMKALDPTALFVFLPAAVGHYVADQRQRLARSLEPAITDINNFLVACVNDALPLLRSSDPSHRLALLGTYFEELARASDETLGEAILAWRDAIHAGIVARLGSVLEQRRDAPPEWREYAARVIAANRSALLARQLQPEYLGMVRSALAQAAAAAQVWPALWQSCAELGSDQPLPAL